MKKTTLLVAILILGGCQTLNNLGNQIKKPSLAVEDVRVSSFSFDELSLVYDIKVNNPNATSFNMTGYNYQKMPSIQLQDISVESISFSGANVSVDFTVDNPNDFGLKINTLDYNLTIEGDRWVSGNALEDTQIKANAVSELKIPVSLDMGKVGMSAYRILSGSGSVDYRVEGTMSVNALHELLGTAEIPFDRSGSVTIGR